MSAAVHIIEETGGRFAAFYCGRRLHDWTTQEQAEAEAKAFRRALKRRATAAIIYASEQGGER